MKYILITISFLLCSSLFLLSCDDNGDPNSLFNNEDPIVCENQDDCPEGLHCLGGICQSECTDDNECSENEICNDSGICEPDYTANQGDNNIENSNNDEPELECEAVIDFGAVILGFSTEQTIEIKNVGGVPLEVLSLELDRLTSYEFVIVTMPEEQSSILPGESKSLTVRYTPTDIGADTGEILLSTNDTDESLFHIQLISHYKGEPNLAADKNELNFGIWAIGDTSEEECVKLTNQIEEGGNRVITITSVYVESRINTQFELLNLTEAELILPPEQELDICLIFHPSSVGDKSDILIIENDDPNEANRSFRINLTGKGGSGTIAAQPSSLNFGSVGTLDSKQMTVNILNQGELALTVSSFEIEYDLNPSVFTFETEASDNGLWRIEPEEQLAVNVSFAPDEFGQHNALLSITSNDPVNSVFKVSLSGIGTEPGLLVSPPSAIFPNTRIGTSSQLTLNFKRINVESIQVLGFEWLQDLSFTPLNEQDFPFLLNNDEVHPVTFVFNPSAEGRAEFDVKILTEPVLEPLQTLTFSGIGITPHMELDPIDIIDFGDIRLGESLIKKVKVTNTGTANLNIHSIEFLQNSFTGFSVQFPDTGELNVSSNDFDNIKVQLTMSDQDSVGEIIGTLKLVTDDIDNGSVEIEAKGNAINPTLEIHPDDNPFDFGPVRLGESKGPLNFVISNPGAGVLQLDSIELTSESIANGYSIEGVPDSFPAFLYPEADNADSKITIKISFTPSGQGHLPGIVSFITNDYHRQDYKLGLIGVGYVCDESEVFCDDICVSRYSVEHCGDCTPCADVPNSISLCDGEECGLKCNEDWKNCDNEYDNGCEINITNDPENCSGCGIKCDLDNTEIHNCIDKQCQVIKCDTGWYNADGVDFNGCECYNFGYDEYGDALGDTNCDGIDGLLDQVIYVAEGESGVGTENDPMGNLQDAINQVEAGWMVWVSKGTYNGPLFLKNGVHIIGNYSFEDGWVQASGNTVTIETTNPESANGNRQVGLYGSNINLNTHIDHISISVADNLGIGGSNYGIWLKNCSNKLSFTDIAVITGTGGKGADGQDGENGEDGKVGGVGDPGCEDSGGEACSNCSEPLQGESGVGFCENSGGKGGKPGHGEGKSGQKGEQGSGGTSGGSQGSPADCNFVDYNSCEGCGSCSGANGGKGHDGADGIVGDHGNAGGVIGKLIGDFWYPSSAEDGTEGDHGQGGGGGGGGAGGCKYCDSYGSSGSGGGGGGCGGTPGRGAQCGGGSFSFYLINSFPAIHDSTIISGIGGTGGNGGDAGEGGAAGTGGQAPGYGGEDSQDDGGCAGAGGNGGKGGHSGAGGGGSGGPSFAIFMLENSWPSLINTIPRALGGGQGGTGGDIHSEQLSSASGITGESGVMEQR